MLRIGPAGWSYKDWAGIVYPDPPPKGFHGAAYLSQFFDTIEINSTFYRPPTPEMAKAWVKHVSGNKNLRYTAKLWRGFTHERNATPADEAEFKAGIEPSWKRTDSARSCSSSRSRSRTRRRSGRTCSAYNAGSLITHWCSKYGIQAG